MPLLQFHRVNDEDLSSKSLYNIVHLDSFYQYWNDRLNVKYLDK